MARENRFYFFEYGKSSMKIIVMDFEGSGEVQINKFM